ncbi:MAG: hemE 9 [Holophagaceae bacterium]|nr:hemE 9 [Holophagaceae bacterium]
MPYDSMTPEQRIQATLALQPVDRIVCAPWVTSYAAQFAGITNKEFMWNWKSAMAAYDKLAVAYPQWDCNAAMHYMYGDANLMRHVGFNHYKFPGTELPDNDMYQTLEVEVVSREELRIVKAKGLQPFYLKLLKNIHKTSTPWLIWGFIKSDIYQKKEIKSTLKRGQSFLYGAGAPTGNELFSLTRGMGNYVKDMFQMKDELVEILWRFNEDFFKLAMKSVKGNGIRRAFVPCTRTSSTFLSPKNFEKFSWPFIKDMAEKLIAQGVVPIFHMDTDWGPNLENFLQLPKGKFAVELDGETDIFKAYEILKGHATISGDIPSSMLALGSPTEVDDYCKKLITTLGKSGTGFILRPACTMPMNAKHENVKAMFQAVDKYGRYN